MWKATPQRQAVDFSWKFRDDNTMKTANRIVATAALAACMVGLLVAAPATAAPQVALGATIAAPGASVSIPLTLANDAGVAGFQFDIQYNAAELVAGAPVSTLGSAYRLVSSEPAPGLRRLVVVPNPNNPSMASGVILNVPFSVKSGVGANSKPLLVSQLVLSNAGAVAVAPAKVLSGLIVDPRNSAVDSDSDGIPDLYEMLHGLNPMDAADASSPSGGGLSNLQKYQQLDTDGDGMPDYWELANGLDPQNPADAALDLDGDGLTNLQEYQHRTNPRVADTDGDGMNDGDEVLAGRNPLLNIPAFMSIINMLLLD